MFTENKIMETLTKTIALAVLLNSSCQSAFAVQFINEQQYNQLLPTSNNQLDYQLKLANKVTVNYHCEIIETADGGFDIDRAGCVNPGQFYHIDWKTEHADTVNLSILGAPSTATMVEHKLWAIAFAHASASSRVQMQYGLKKGPLGTFDLTKNFASGEAFGNYFDRQMNPNYFVSKGLQESSLGNDLPDVQMSEELEDDGVLQIEYPGSAWAELQGVVGGGFPTPYANMIPQQVLSSNNGPASNILGSSISSGFYNGSALAIVSGSLPWNQGSDSSQDSMHLFLQASKDPDALSMIMSFMYNRGPYAAKDQVLNTQAIFDHCVQIEEDLEDDWTCFQKQNDFGARYIRQIPDVTNKLTAFAKNPATSYDESLTKSDINNYLDLLQRYGFYPAGVIELAKQAASAEFDKLAQQGVISYRNDFGKVLAKIIVQLPIYELGEGGPYDESSKKEVYFYNQYSQTSLVVTNSAAGLADKNEYVLPQNNITIDLNGSFTQLTTSDGVASCAGAATASLNAFAASKDNTYVSLSSQITFNVGENGQCIFTTGPHEPPAEPLEGYWHSATLYSNPGEVVIDSGDCKQYSNEWYVVAGQSPSVVYGDDPWGVWRKVSDDLAPGCSLSGQ
ncbi:MAG: hypothetical protein ACI8WB_003038 [Phenylobacterium sp.]|jgi:hypothetical protein